MLRLPNSDGERWECFYADAYRRFTSQGDSPNQADRKAVRVANRKMAEWKAQR